MPKTGRAGEPDLVRSIRARSEHLPAEARADIDALIREIIRLRIELEHRGFRFALAESEPRSWTFDLAQPRALAGVRRRRLLPALVRPEDTGEHAGLIPFDRVMVRLDGSGTVLLAIPESGNPIEDRPLARLDGWLDPEQVVIAWLEREHRGDLERAGF